MGYKASKWTRELVIEGIRRHHGLGADLTLSRMRRADLALVGAAVRHFGGWQWAVEAAGFDYQAVRLVGKKHRRLAITKWTQSSILQQLRDLYQLGQDIRPAAIAARLPGLYNAARKHWRTWKAVLEAAGINTYSMVAARERHQGWKRRWLGRLGIQASDLKPKRGRGDRRYRRSLALASTTASADWLDSLRRSQVNG